MDSDSLLQDSDKQSVVGGPFFQGQNLKYCNQIRRILEMAFACAFASRITLIAINSLCVIFACIVIYYGSAGKSKCDLQSINCHFQIALIRMVYLWLIFPFFSIKKFSCHKPCRIINLVTGLFGRNLCRTEMAVTVLQVYSERGIGQSIQKNAKIPRVLIKT